jgi:hypothetical protein
MLIHIYGDGENQIIQMGLEVLCAQPVRNPEEVRGKVNVSPAATLNKSKSC